MKAIVITEAGKPEVLQMTERPKPHPSANEVLIKVEAAGVNRPDVAQRKGVYPPPADAPQDIPGLEVAGIIELVGDSVTRWKAGDQVCALVKGGGYAEYCTAPEGSCLPLPASLSFVEAASLPETFFTVWSNVFDRANLQPGESLLVHGGSSGIGVAAIQIATALGSKVYVTAGSDDKCKFCEQLGASKAINYKTQNFAAVLKDLTSGMGVDVILDMIGGDYTSDNLNTLALEGRLVLINTMKGKDVQIDLGLVMAKRLNITGSMLRARDVGFKSAIASSLENNVWPLLEQGKVKPVIYKVFPVQQAAQAHELMESSEHIGKVMLSFD
ncbi:zinc-binding dehydrogenase [Pedobacter sp. HMWF019]|uniref:NAD(P)H-quinone oxidoreductase n=1 Tax=Pedobacter sp. HMWF019 TaxID=2056856 RepID=UPI000D345533|nr:NAD(P)H-quinone oxidoreductase [Pedobacter sp. HMWF019]PTS93336.1 zinc-binding dehydrogenase [Pedobacter sp. HMWF019]